jgi:hypothetical protein
LTVHHSGRGGDVTEDVVVTFQRSMRGGLPVIVLFVLLLILIVTYMFYVSFILCFLKCVMYFVAGGGLLYVSFIFICEYGLLPLCWMLDSTVGPREGADGGAKKRCSWTTVS